MNELFVELNRLMVKYRFTSEKTLSQHFVGSRELIDSLVKEARLSKQDIALEIGAGTGFLTRELLKKCPVVAVEYDEKLVEVLRGDGGQGGAANAALLSLIRQRQLTPRASPSSV